MGGGVQVTSTSFESDAPLLLLLDTLLKLAPVLDEENPRPVLLLLLKLAPVLDEENPRPVLLLLGTFTHPVPLVPLLQNCPAEQLQMDVQLTP